MNETSNAHIHLLIILTSAKRHPLLITFIN